MPVRTAYSKERDGGASTRHSKMRGKFCVHLKVSKEVIASSEGYQNSAAAEKSRKSVQTIALVPR
jgi:uncharacterized protein YegP (UPF0339 family)